MAAVTRARPLARCCWAWAVRSCSRPRRWKHTARHSALRLSPLFSSAVACRRSWGRSSQLYVTWNLSRSAVARRRMQDAQRRTTVGAMAGPRRCALGARVAEHAGEPWQHYDLGHGYCSYTFFEQCPHRMACARCDFYIPKPSGRAQLLEAKAEVDRRLALIPLTEAERLAVEQDRDALGKLLEGLADTPTPAGPTPREIAARPPFSSCPPDST